MRTSKYENLRFDLEVAAAIVSDESVEKLLLSACKAIQDLEVSRTEILHEVAEWLESQARDGFDSAHGKPYEEWEPLAKDATRLLIASEVLGDYDA